MAKKKSAGSKAMFESKYDANKLRELITTGHTADQIQEALGIASKQSLRQHILKLINEDRQFYDVPGLYVRNQRLPMVNFKGEIRLTKKQLSFPNSTYKHGDKFEIHATNEVITLTRMGVESTEVETEVESEPVEE